MEIKKRFKMHKKGKFWIVIPILFLGTQLAVGGETVDAEEQVDENEVLVHEVDESREHETENTDESPEAINFDGELNETQPEEETEENLTAEHSVVEEEILEDETAKHEAEGEYSGEESEEDVSDLEKNNPAESLVDGANDDKADLLTEVEKLEEIEGNEVTGKAELRAKRAVDTEADAPAEDAFLEEVNEEDIITSIEKKDGFFEIQYQNGVTGRLLLVEDNVFRVYIDPSKEFADNPAPQDPKRPAKIIDVEAYESASQSNPEIFAGAQLNPDGNVISTPNYNIEFNKNAGTFRVLKDDGRVVLEELEPIRFEGNKSVQTLKQDENEQFFGGGMQNGRFTHKGQDIEIRNTNVWVDGGVSSPSPFYWSTNGYGVIRNTFQQGVYSFSDLSKVETTHNDGKFDSFYIIEDGYYDLIHTYHQLTGMPAVMPLFGFYVGHLNAYNRDYWQEVPAWTPNAKLFEDGKYYVEKQPGQANGQGHRETLNGENGHPYQFTARKVIDRYNENDIPLGYFLPNDGYGAGYGQEDTHAENIQNLKAFGDYARENGVELAVWTEENLYPADPDNPKPQERDFTKEVEIAGVKGLKTDVAWVGNGYSFGLNATDDAYDEMIRVTNGEVRPFIITVDGWAGTQRNAAVWTGDQSGGNWEYIRFHIPTLIGTGLSGVPAVGSDSDGIFGGNNKEVNIREYQFKSFTPIQMDMDGWGFNTKTPFAFDEEATDINRAYLKLKSQLMPYIYSMAVESRFEGKPMVRAMFLEFPDEAAAYTNQSMYQYMWGDSYLVVPIYNGNKDDDGNAIRDGIFLPGEDTIWYDLYDGSVIRGGKIYNNVKAPLWKLPVYVKEGAIVPITDPNNNPGEIPNDKREFMYYPSHTLSEYKVREDDGASTDYLDGDIAETKVQAQVTDNELVFKINATTGNYDGFEVNRATYLNVLSDNDVDSITVFKNGEVLEVNRVDSLEEFNTNTNVFYYDEAFTISEFFEDIAPLESIQRSVLRIKLEPMDITKNSLEITVAGVNVPELPAELKVDDSAAVVSNVAGVDEGITHQSLAITWDEQSGADYYEVDVDGTVYTNITTPQFVIDRLLADTPYTFKVRSVKGDTASQWSTPLELSTYEQVDLANFSISVEKFESTLPDQPGEELEKLFNNDLSDLWHTNWGESGKAAEFDITVSLGEDKPVHGIMYFPRENAGNGTILQGEVFYTDAEGKEQSLATFNWAQDNTPKFINIWGLNDQKGLNAKDFRIHVTRSVGNWGSGAELIFMHIPELEQFSQDVDPTFILNYLGVVNGKDADYDYAGPRADLNQDGVIDVYDMHRALLADADAEDSEPSGQILLEVSEEEDSLFKVTIHAKDFENVGGYGLFLTTDGKEFALVRDSLTVGELSNEMPERYSKFKTHADGDVGLFIAQVFTDPEQTLSGSGILNTFNIRATDENATAEDLEVWLLENINNPRILSPSSNDQLLELQLVPASDQGGTSVPEEEAPSDDDLDKPGEDITDVVVDEGPEPGETTPSYDDLTKPGDTTPSYDDLTKLGEDITDVVVDEGPEPGEKTPSYDDLTKLGDDITNVVVDEGSEPGETTSSYDDLTKLGEDITDVVVDEGPEPGETTPSYDDLTKPGDTTPSYDDLTKPGEDITDVVVDEGPEPGETTPSDDDLTKPGEDITDVVVDEGPKPGETTASDDDLTKPSKDIIDVVVDEDTKPDEKAQDPKQPATSQDSKETTIVAKADDKADPKKAQDSAQLPQTGFVSSSALGIGALLAVAGSAITFRRRK